MDEEEVINLEQMHGGLAQMRMIPLYRTSAISRGRGKNVVITGKAPVWMYLQVAHALAETAKRLAYESPVTGRVVIFDNNQK